MITVYLLKEKRLPEILASLDEVLGSFLIKQAQESSHLH